MRGYKIGVYSEITSEIVNSLVNTEVDAVFIEPKKEYVRVAREAGLKVYVCIWTFKAPATDVKLGVESVYGERVLWANSGCPNNEIIRNSTLREIKEILESLDVDGIVLDGVRFPSPGSGLKAFLSCFCES